MKILLTTIAALLVVGCGGPSAPDISIHEAAQKGNIEAVKQHLDAGADVNAKDDVVEWTPLLHAAEGGNKEIIELLIAKGADVNAKNLRGETSLYDVVGRGHKEIAELLIAAGADVNAKDNDGSTPLHNAAKHDEVVELLIAEGADVNAKNTLGWTPLDRAITSNLTETADLLRKHGGKTGDELEAEGK